MAETGRQSRLHARGPEWAIVVVLRNGQRYFYYDGVHGGRVLEEWGRESRARRFMTEAEAQAMADRFVTNSVAKAYEVVRLRPLR